MNLLTSGQVVLEEGHDRKVIFSSFDPDVATLVRLKQPRYPVRPFPAARQLCSFLDRTGT